MSDNQLKDKAVKIQGKDYVLVADRVLYFNEKYPAGSIQTKLLSDVASDLIVVKATVMPDISMSERKFTGYSQEKVGDGFINKTSALENAETSAVGRALAMMGIGVIESIASVDELNKASNHSSGVPVGSPKFATAKQIDWMRDEARKVTGLEHTTDVDEWLARKDVLSIPPQKVPIYKVKDAVDKIASLKGGPAPEPDTEMSDEEMAAAIDMFEKEDVPY